MPTGYTHDIKDGISFEKFALNCARAFGACVTLRDEPGGGEIIPEEFTPNDYYLTKIQDDEKKLEAIKQMTAEECTLRSTEEWCKAEENRIFSLSENQQLRVKYEEMLAKVKAWEPPTNDHFELKRFMIDQIESSITFDCIENYYSNPIPLKNGEDWRAEKITSLKQSIIFARTSYQKEVELAKSRTNWIKALRASLKEIEK